MGDPYGFPEDLRRLISSSRTAVADPLSLHPFNTTYGHHDTTNMLVGEVFFPPPPPPHHHHDYYYSSFNPNTTCTSVVAAAAASDHAAFCCNNSNNNTDAAAAEKLGWMSFDAGGTNRWPRQETLSLLEIRSRLNSKFRDNIQKAPLWNQISRIMAEEFGYQRSGKKCKEKFENLYKYYKKTKEGKASRQDGKHYRFFRQLEAICGAGGSEPTTTTAATHHHHHAAGGNTSTSVSIQTPTFKNNNNNGDHRDVNLSTNFSNSSDQLETSSSEDLSAIAMMMKHSSSSRDNKKREHKKEVTRSSPSKWKAKVEEVVGSHMRKIIQTQDVWMERMLNVVEQREQEMATREEERKKKELSMRFDREVNELWAKERAWVESRDAALMEVMRKHFGKQEEQQQRWSEMEISNLIQLRSSGSFEEHLRENEIWGEIAEKMRCLGYERSEGECKQIWDEISISLGRTVVDCDGAIKTTTSTTRPWCLGLKVTDDDDL